MLRIRATQLIACMLALMVSASALSPSSLAESSTTITGGFTTAEAGVFTVSLTAKTSAGCTGAPVEPSVFGPFDVDAVGVANGVTPEPIDFCVLYTDTQAERGPFVVRLSVESFELNSDEIPTFEGADQVHFQIPNRYLVLSNIGPVTGENADPGVGAVSDVQSDAGGDFSSGSLTIASVAGGVGTGSSLQELGLTLNVPAGVYPGEYDSTITVETYTGP